MPQEWDEHGKLINSAPAQEWDEQGQPIGRDPLKTGEGMGAGHLADTRLDVNNPGNPISSGEESQGQELLAHIAGQPRAPHNIDEANRQSLNTSKRYAGVEAGLYSTGLAPTPEAAAAGIVGGAVGAGAGRWGGHALGSVFNPIFPKAGEYGGNIGAVVGSLAGGVSGYKNVGRLERAAAAEAAEKAAAEEAANAAGRQKIAAAHNEMDQDISQGIQQRRSAYAEMESDLAKRRAAEGKAVPISQSPYANRNAAARSFQEGGAGPSNSLASSPNAPSRYSLSPGLMQEGTPHSGVQIVPEPRPLFPGEDPNYMASIERTDELPELAGRAKPGAGKQLQQLGRPIIYKPRPVIGQR